MKLLRFLFSKSGWSLWASVLAGLASGYGLSNVMRLTHQTLEVAPLAGMTNLLPFAASFVLFAVAAVVSEKIMINLSETLSVDLRHRLAHQLLHTELRVLEQAGPDHLWSLLVQEVEECTRFICWLPNAFVNLAIVTGCTLYILWLSPLTAAFNVVFVLLGILAYQFSTRRVHRLRREATLAGDHLFSRLRYLTHGLKPLLLSRAKTREFLDRHLRRATAEVRARAIPARTLHSMAERFAESLVLINLGCLLFLLPRYGIHAPGAREGLILATLFMLSPLKTLLDVVPRAINAQVALERMAALGLDVNAAPAPEADLPASPAPTFHELALEDIAFAYDTSPGKGEADFRVGPVSLTLRAGETVFLVGGNGSGKTTLAKLVCGLYQPQQGVIRLDGHPLTAADAADYRQLFTTVFADDPLFDHLLGVSESQLTTRASRLLADIRLAHKVSLQERAFSTTDLSSGQKRRLLLFNALLEDRPILIFDEWAAEQDPVFRQLFYDHLLPTLRAEGRAVLVITHDDRYFDRADHLIKLDRGRLVSETTVAAHSTA